MKKSKIIVPALALIAFSTAASITGTVAWFTASRTATVNAGTYTVASTAAGLDVTVSSGICTTGSGKAVTVAAHSLLTDASFDHKTSKIYEPNSDGTGLKDANGVALASADTTNMKRGVDAKGTVDTSDDDTIYSVFTWGIKFSVEFKENGEDLGIFLDMSESTFTNSGSTTGLGFRMAFVGKTASVTEKKVLAPLQAKANCKYTNSAATFERASANVYTNAYSAPNYPDLIATDTTNTLPVDGAETEAAAKQRNAYLGKIGFTKNTKVEIEFDVVCWFEGTDPNIVTLESPASTVFDTVTASLNFDAIKLAANS